MNNPQTTRPDREQRLSEALNNPQATPMKYLSYVLLILFSVMALRAMSPEARRSYEAFERKAESGDPEAMYRLSALLERGFDTIPADTARSVSLLKRSARAGYAPAMNRDRFPREFGALSCRKPRFRAHMDAWRRRSRRCQGRP